MKKYLRSVLWLLGVFLLLFTVVDFAYFRFYAVRIFASKKSPYTSTALLALSPRANYIEIKALGIRAPVLYPPKAQSSYEDYLKQGVVHFPGTAMPGQLGNCYIFGHSSDYIWVKGNYKTVFAALPEIKTGQHVMVSDSTGKVFDYTVTKTFVTGPNDLSVLDQHNNQKYLLTLQTSYPLGTALERFIVQAEIN